LRRCARLLDPDTRLLTLTGPGGVGKTRLAAQVAAAAHPAFADGVAFVPLAPITDPDLVLPTIAQMLGVDEVAGQSLSETLGAALHAKQILLVLDNFEQTLPAAPVIVALLAAAPRVRALVTTRASLRMRGERVHLIEPLAVPALSFPPLEALAQYEAVRLFVARARDAQPDFALTHDTAPAVAEICARLDGLPLAIELAAARTRFLPPEKLLERLGNRLEIIKGGARDLPARQRTLRATIDWSHGLLDSGEQMLFAWLAAFAGGCTLEAIEAVCAAKDDLPVDVLDGVESLLDKSLLRRESGPHRARDGEPRFTILETVHEYARERLEACDERAVIRRAHADHFLGVAQRAASELTRAGQATWLARLDADNDNMRTALAWARDHAGDDDEMALQLAGALWRFWWMRPSDRRATVARGVARARRRVARGAGTGP